MPDCGTAPVLIRRDHIAQIFRVHRGGERRRSHQVTEHHGELAALGVERRTERGRGERRGRNRRRGRQVALGRKGGRLFSVPQGRQWLRHGLGSGRTPIGSQDEELAVEVSRDVQSSN
jgi:hypothetical protein